MEPGQIVASRFVVEALAGAGAMSVVYRALDRQTGERVALKVLRADAEVDPRRLGREIDALRRLSHPRVARYVAHGAAPAAQAWLAIEWVEGEWLDACLARVERLAVPDALALARAVASALAAAHAAGVVHRDLKPANVALPGGRFADARLVDFGIAVVRDATDPTRLTQTGTLVGTPSYMAPEQATGERDIDARADVHALGAVLFRCLTGRDAFRAADPLAVLMRIVFAPPPRARELRPEVPAALESLLAALMAKPRDARPADGAAVLGALDALGDAARAAVTAASSAPTRQDGAAPAAAASGGLLFAERRFLCLVVVRAADAAPDRRDDAAAAPLARIAAEHDAAALERLADGTCVAAVAPRDANETAADAARRAAHLALALHAALPRASVALVGGRGDASDIVQTTEVIDRGAALARAAGARGVVCVDAHVATLLEQRFELAPAAQTPVSDARCLVRARESAGPRTVLGRPSPFVGRETELGALARLFESCVLERAARVAVVTGEPGLGKSRLRDELLARLSRRVGRAPVVWRAAGEPLVHAGSPLGVLGQLLCSAAQVAVGAPTRARRAALERLVGRYVPPARAAQVVDGLAPAMGADEAAAAPDSPAEIDPRAARALRRAALAELVRGAADAAPLLVVLDDAQWSDAPSLGALGDAAAACADAPWTLLLLGRPEAEAQLEPCLRAGAAAHWRLLPLRARASAALVEATLGGEVDPADVRRLLELAAGNPLFLEELVRARHATGQLEAGVRTVAAIVEARLARLPLDARRVLRAASVFGLVAWPRGVAAVLASDDGAADAVQPSELVAVGAAPREGTSGASHPATAITAPPQPPLAREPSRHEREVLACLEQLRDAELLVRAPHAAGRFPGQAEYAFRHVLLREAALATIAPQERAAAHRAAARWLEAAGEPDAAVLAEHLARGESPRRAALWFLRAARQALRGDDLGAAVERGARGLAFLAQGPAAAAGEARDDAIATALRARLHQTVALACLWSGEVAAAQRAARDALAVIAPGTAEWADAMTAAAGAAGALRDRTDLEALGAAALAHDGDDDHALRACAVIASHAALDAPAAAVPLLRRVDRILARRRGACEPGLLGYVAAARALYARARGDVAEALSQLRVAAAHYDAAGARRAGCTAGVNLAAMLGELGDHAAAEAALRDALVRADRVRAPMFAALARANLAEALWAQGRFDEALAAVEQAREEFTRFQDRRMLAAAWVLRARVLVALGDYAGAEASAAVVCDDPVPREATRAYASAVRAKACLALGRPAEALALARAADAALARLGGAIEDGEATVGLVLADALEANGLPVEAQRARADAWARVQARAARIADPALRRSFLEGHAEHRALAPRAG